MNAKPDSHELTVKEDILNRLNQTVIQSTAYFANVDPNLSDGHQTAHGILAGLVFWHKQYVAIARALIDGKTPDLLVGTYEGLNRNARQHALGTSMIMMAYNLSCEQREFAELVQQIPDWTINFPVKQDSEPCSLSDRLVEIEANVRQHMHRLERLQKEHK